MPHEIVIQNLNLAFLNGEGKASLEQALETTVENFIEPLISEKYTYTIKFSDLESHNPMATITLRPNEEASASLGQINFVFSNMSSTHHVTAQCSNFVVAKLITPQKKNPENFKHITEKETLFAQACENFQNTKNYLEQTHPSLFFTAKEIEKMTSYPNFLGNYSEEISEQKKCIALISFFADKLTSITSQEISHQELTTRTQILNNLTKFLNLYSEGNIPSSEDIATFRSTVDKLQSAGSSKKRILFGFGMAIFGLIGIAGLVLVFTLIIAGSMGGIAAGLALVGVTGIAIGLPGFLGSFSQYRLHQPKDIAVDFYLLVDKMEADRTMKDEGKLVLSESIAKEEQTKDPSQAALFAPEPLSPIEMKYDAVFKALKEKSEDIESNDYELLREGLKKVLENKPENAEEIKNSISETSKFIDIRLAALKDICETKNLSEKNFKA